MALGRPVWSGHIRLSLVSLPVKLYSATESGSRLSFRQIHEPSGKPIKYEKVVPGVGPVDREEIVRGFEVEKDRYVLLEDEDFDEIKLEQRKTLDLVQFVDACEIDPIYFHRPYYVAPDGEMAEEGFVVIREALRRERKVGLGQMVMRGREYIGALKPCSRGLLLETLRFEEELRRADPYFAEIEDIDPPEELLDLATELIGRKTAPFDAGVFEDQYSKALQDLVERKAKGKSLTVAGADSKGERGGEVIDLMAALRESLGETKGGGKSGSGGRGKSGGSKSGASKSSASSKSASSRSASSKSASSKSASSKSGGSKGSGSTSGTSKSSRRKSDQAA